jgi:hypothetical protein
MYCNIAIADSAITLIQEKKKRMNSKNNVRINKTKIDRAERYDF